ncbi:hypothetical protein COLO4_31392 [Corchorus olitorius]|uniref:Homeobox domain-containing protein n=1 Tax=Corchorus olitorius TaxID=93759 RepID=A0A1R3H4I2_9ROSI|nr:hypothetical protein COLO4_31392 [Corchorus olitorius]
MFKSKPCNTHHQWQHDINSSLISSGCHRPPYNSVNVRLLSVTVTGCEERSPEPKPRWNPKPEQIRILEAIFNSGMVNPPRDEIRKIRAQLQEYGQVGDANVFYWFQNRKSRSKHKLRNLQNSKQPPQQNQQTLQTPPPITNITTLTAPSSSSSSSSEKSSPNKSVGESGAVGPGGAARSTVFINDVAFEVAVGPFNVREAFGDDAILINSSGQPILTNEWGLTLHSLQHGGFYYLVRSLSPFPV